MTLSELKKLARARGVIPLGSKLEIIRAIQTAEGYQACFATRPVADCPEISCLWRHDCLQQARG
ncbi:MAG: SAP domain-containing protein [Geobacteraceae bacterium]|nr:SAP domain-containing protein [Geobacteraceae bacterium]